MPNRASHTPTPFSVTLFGDFFFREKEFGFIHISFCKVNDA